MKTHLTVKQSAKVMFIYKLLTALYQKCLKYIVHIRLFGVQATENQCWNMLYVILFQVFEFNCVFAALMHCSSGLQGCKICI